MKRLSFVSVAGLAATVLASGSVWAQAYPNKTIRLQVPFAPGGTTDIVARVIAEPLGKVLGQSVIVENKAGGGGVVGATETARAAPDGYNLGMATVSTTAANPAINPKIPYNVLTDFTPIINIAATPNVIAVHPSFPAKDYAGFLAEVRKNPGKYSYASSGTGGIGHLQTELWKSLTGAFITHIPYRGAGPAVQDLIGGQVDLFITTPASVVQHVKSGKLKALAVSSATRLAALPQVPTAAEAGLKGFTLDSWFALHGPAGLPAEVVQTLNTEIGKILALPDIRRRAEEAGTTVEFMSPAQLADYTRKELDHWGKVIKSSKITAD
jgi:tripartite-type tricarboxylate transporter receptor subunit TctC